MSEIAKLIFGAAKKDISKKKEKDLPLEQKIESSRTCTTELNYALKPEDRPHKPYQGWWINQMEAMKEKYPDHDQDQLNQIVRDNWNEKSDKNKIKIWAMHDRQIEKTKKSKKLKGV